MTGTDASLRLVDHGYAVLPGPVNLQPTASGAWTGTGLQITLPAAGIYQLDATVRGNLQASGADFNVWLQARLVDTTTGAVVPDSECIVHQYWLNQADPASLGGNASAAVQIEHTVPGPRTVSLEACRVNLRGASLEAGIGSDTVSGRTTLRYVRLA